MLRIDVRVVCFSFFFLSQMHYSGGVYSHHFAEQLGLDDYNPFELTNHAVLCVGWGVTSAAEGSIPYWSVHALRQRSRSERALCCTLHYRMGNCVGFCCAVLSCTIRMVNLNLFCCGHPCVCSGS
jgi:hypothetical protein